MEIAFCGAPHNHSTLLQQVPVNVGSGYAAIGRETDADEFAETTRVVVSLGLCVAKGLEDRVGLNDLPLQKAKSFFCCHGTAGSGY